MEAATPRPYSKLAGYRSDIDGLRAIAVILVILYHANLEIVPGGYIGVDVFFVISGFLICNLLISEIDSEVFSFANFYVRRIRRLAPTAGVVLIFSTLWFAQKLHIQDYRNFGESILAFLLLSSNWYFLQDVGYFSPAAEIKPLLHTWSLGVEEQFYFLFPILLALVWQKMGTKSVLALTIWLGFFSFFYSCFLLSDTQTISFAFYNSFARFWEILAGCCLAISQRLPSPKFNFVPIKGAAANTLISIIGLALIFYPALTYSKATIFPGPSALPPVIGTVLLIYSGPVSAVGRILGTAPLRYIGLLSYALYLWHWPIFIATQSVLAQSHFSIYWPYLAISVSVALSIFTYHLIEQPVRTKAILASTFAPVKAYAVLCLFLIFCASTAIHSEWNYLRTRLVFGEMGVALTHIDSARSRYLAVIDNSFDGKISRYSQEDHHALPCSFDHGNSLPRLKECLAGNLRDTSYLVIGDSIGRDTMAALRKAYPSKHFLMLHHSSCLPVEFKNAINKSCFPGLFSLLDPLLKKNKIKGIILAGRLFPEEVSSYIEGIRRIETLGVPTLVVAGTPTFLDGIDQFVIKRYMTDQEVPKKVDVQDGSMFREGQDLMMASLREKIGFTSLVDVYSFRCNAGRCPLFFEDDISRPIIFDREHLTLEGIDWLSDLFLQNKTMNSFLKSH